MKPLAGKRIAITRSPEDFEPTAQAVRARGGIPIPCPAISLVLPENTEPLDRAIRSLSQFDWIVLTSAHAFQFFHGRMLSLNVPLPDSIRTAAIGQPTATAASERGIQPAFVAQKSTGEGMIQEFARLHGVREKRFLLPLSDIARATVGNRLREEGGAVTEVTAYCNRPADAFPPEFIHAIEDKAIDWTTFFSSSAVENFYRILAKYPSGQTAFRVASIGPSTSETVRRQGIEPDAEADPHTLEGMLDAIAGFEQPADQ